MEEEQPTIEEYYDSVVNLLTAEEIDAVVANYKEKYEFIINDQGCEIMGKKIKRPRKRGGIDPQWRPLARKNDGYLQVTVAGVPKRPELFPSGKAQKVEWHRLCWRQHNNYAKCVKGQHICHRCGNRDCGTEGHLAENTRSINEEQKYCRYYYTQVEDEKTIFLSCDHDPPCIPKFEPRKAVLITDSVLVDKLNKM